MSYNGTFWLLCANSLYLNVYLQISVMVRRFSEENDEVCTKALFDEMITNFAQKKKWTNRQM